MIRNLHLTIIDGAHRGLRSLVGRRRSSMLSRLDNPEGSEVTLDPDNPEGSEVTLDPDNPEGSEVTLDPDNPEGSEVTLDPDNPEGSEVTLDPDNPDALLYAAALGGAPGCGCGHACACQGDDRRSVAPRPGTRPRDYSGFVIVKTASGVDDALAESLHDLAQEHRLDGLQRMLELRFEDGDEGGAEAAGPDVSGSADGLEAANQPPERNPAADGGAAGAYCQGGAKPTLPVQGPPAYAADGPLVSFPAIVLGGVGDRRRTVDTLKALEARAMRSGFRPQSSLSSFWRVDVRPRAELAEQLIEQLNLLPEVDLAYRELAVDNPFSSDQNYLEDAPVGIGLKRVRHQLQKALVASDTPSSGHPLTICDLEQQWRVDHEAFAEANPRNGDPTNPPPTGEPLGLLFGANRDAADEENGYGHHGNAVLGQLVGSQRIEGAVAGVARPVLASHYWSRELLDAQGAPSAFAGTNGHVAAAILNSLAEPYLHNKLDPEGRLEAGDVLLLEVQRGRYPTEVDPLDFEAIRLASALGVHVVEAAGNGGHDLDAYVDPDTDRSFNRRASSFRDSGAIFVGAAYAALPHDRVSFSNYGSRVDCFAWGTGVTTCGYGNLDGDERKNLYTN
ncbi:MAG TPA: hypothetical protein VKU40_01930, partial [Thermoanaerobaculia bacterium]|nr:hypothetical protein [Thermoanaerobaculia bacterium]